MACKLLLELSDSEVVMSLHSNEIHGSFLDPKSTNVQTTNKVIGQLSFTLHTTDDFIPAIDLSAPSMDSNPAKLYHNWFFKAKVKVIGF